MLEFGILLSCNRDYFKKLPKEKGIVKLLLLFYYPYLGKIIIV